MKIHADSLTTYDRNDLTEVLPLVDAYWRRHAELEAAGKYPYHAEFFDLVPDAERPETPIYMLAQLFSLVRGAVVYVSPEAVTA